VVDREVAGGEIAGAVGALTPECFLYERAEFRKSVVESLPRLGGAAFVAVVAGRGAAEEEPA
jgi:hypothetical protein